MGKYKRTSYLQLVITMLLYHGGNATSFSCTPSLSEPLCPGSIATCTCVVDGNNSFTRFNFTNLNMKIGCSDSIIDLSQPTLCNFLNGTCGPYLSAAVVGGSDCTHTSILTITPNSTLDGLGIICEDMSSRQIIGNVLLRVTATPGPVGNMTVTSPSVDQLTVTWTPPTTGGVPTSYNVTINDSSNTLVPIPTSGSLQYTFTNLTNGTLYTVSVVAINCAGSSNGTKGTGSCMSPTGSSSTSSPWTPASSSPGPIKRSTVIDIVIAVLVIVAALAIAGVLTCTCIWYCKKTSSHGVGTPRNNLCCCDGPSSHVKQE